MASKDMRSDSLSSRSRCLRSRLVESWRKNETYRLPHDNQHQGIIIKAILTNLLALAFALSLQAGDITGRVILEGKPPVPRPFVMDKDSEGAYLAKLPQLPNYLRNTNGVPWKMSPVQHRLPYYRVSPTGGLADVVVILQAPRHTNSVAKAPLTIKHEGCFLHPYVSAIQAGQPVAITNADLVLHNIHPTPAYGINEGANLSMPPGHTNFFTFPSGEPFLPLKCDIHPWEFAYVTVVPHPWFAVTDKDGNFTIRDAPTGDYMITATHRRIHQVRATFTKEHEPSGTRITLENVPLPNQYSEASQPITVTRHGAQAEFILQAPETP